MTDHLPDPLAPRRPSPRGRAPHQLSSRWSLLLSLLFMTVVETTLAVALGRWEFAVSAVLFLAAAGAGWRSLPIASEVRTADPAVGSARPRGSGAPGRTDLPWGIATVVLVIGAFVLGGLGTR